MLIPRRVGIIPYPIYQYIYIYTKFAIHGSSIYLQPYKPYKLLDPKHQHLQLDTFAHTWISLDAKTEVDGGKGGSEKSGR